MERRVTFYVSKLYVLGFYRDKKWTEICVVFLIGIWKNYDTLRGTKKESFELILT